MTTMGEWLLAFSVALGYGALVWVIVALLVRLGDLERKLMAMSAQFPHAAYIDLQRAQVELAREQQRVATFGPQGVVPGAAGGYYDEAVEAS